MAELEAGREAHQEFLGVSVITPVGVYPGDDEFARASSREPVEVILKKAAEKLKITDTKDWVASVDGRQIDPSRTFHQEKLKCVVDIDWHQHGGGGGA